MYSTLQHVGDEAAAPDSRYTTTFDGLQLKPARVCTSSESKHYLLGTVVKLTQELMLVPSN